MSQQLLAVGAACRQEGMLALWTGLGPNIVRNAVVSTTQLVAYDQIKQTMLQSGGEGLVGSAGRQV